MRVPLLDDDVDLCREYVLVQVEMPVVADGRFGATVVHFRFVKAHRTNVQSTVVGQRPRDTLFSGYCCSERRGNDLVG